MNLSPLRPSTSTAGVSLFTISAWRSINFSLHHLVILVQCRVSRACFDSILVTSTLKIPTTVYFISIIYSLLSAISDWFFRLTRQYFKSPQLRVNIRNGIYTCSLTLLNAASSTVAAVELRASAECNARRHT